MIIIVSRWILFKDYWKSTFRWTVSQLLPAALIRNSCHVLPMLKRKIWIWRTVSIRMVLKKRWIYKKYFVCVDHCCNSVRFLLFNLKSAVQELRTIVGRLENRINDLEQAPVPYLAICPAKPSGANQAMPEPSGTVEGDEDVDLFGSDSEVSGFNHYATHSQLFTIIK